MTLVLIRLVLVGGGDTEIVRVIAPVTETVFVLSFVAEPEREARDDCDLLIVPTVMDTVAEASPLMESCDADHDRLDVRVSDSVTSTVKVCVSESEFVSISTVLESAGARDIVRAADFV